MDVVLAHDDGRGVDEAAQRVENNQVAQSRAVVVHEQAELAEVLEHAQHLVFERQLRDRQSALLCDCHYCIKRYMRLLGGLDSVEGAQPGQRHLTLQVLLLLQTLLHRRFHLLDAFVSAAFRVVHRKKPQQTATRAGGALFQRNHAAEHRRRLEPLVDHAADGLVLRSAADAVSVCAHQQNGRDAVVGGLGVQVNRVQPKREEAEAAGALCLIGSGARKPLHVEHHHIHAVSRKVQRVQAVERLLPPEVQQVDSQRLLFARALQHQLLVHASDRSRRVARAGRALGLCGGRRLGGCIGA